MYIKDFAIFPPHQKKAYKIGIIYTITDRAIKMSDEIFDIDYLNFTIDCHFVF